MGILLLLAGCGGAAENAELPGDARPDALATWMNSDFVRSLDPRTLEQVGSLGDALGEYGSLADAVRHADLAVLGTVERVQLGEPTLTTFRVERYAKGRGGETLTYAPNFGPRPGDTWTSAKLAVDAEEPVLLAGDRAVLLLESLRPDLRRTYGQNVYAIQAWTGGYRSTKGRVHAVAPGFFFEDAEGLTEDAFMDRIEALAR